MIALYASSMLLLTAPIGPSLAKDEWSYTIFTMSYRNGLATVLPKIYDPIASKADGRRNGTRPTAECLPVPNTGDLMADWSFTADYDPEQCAPNRLTPFGAWPSRWS